MTNTVLLVDGVAPPRVPSSLDIGIMDISADDAGRASDAGRTMYKMRQGEIHTIKLAWTNVTPAESAAILTMFAPEYVDLTYNDPKTNAAVTRTFYRGDVSAAVKWWTVGYKRYDRISFDCTERSVHT